MLPACDKVNDQKQKHKGKQGLVTALPEKKLGENAGEKYCQ